MKILAYLKTITRLFCTAIALTTVSPVIADTESSNKNPRARDLGVIVGTFPTGKLNAIPLDKVLKILDKYQVRQWDKSLPPSR